MKKSGRDQAATDSGSACGGVNDGTLGAAGLCADHVEAVRRYCRSRTPSEADAEDALQETLVRYLTRRPADLKNAEAWLIGVATRVCMEQRRRSARESVGGGIATPEAAAAQSRDAADIAVSNAWTRELLRRLRPIDRRVLSLLYLEDRSAGEVAELNSTSPGNIRILALRARRRAREILEDLGQSTAGVLALPALAWHRISGRLRQAVLRIHAVRGRGLVEEPLGALSTGGSLLIPLLVASIAGAPAAASATAVAHRSGVSGAATSIPAPRFDDDAVAGRLVSLGSGSAARQSGPAPSQGAGPIATPGVVSSLLQPGNGAQQQDVGFVSVTPSPDYAQDHTIFASGNVLDGCTWNCLVLFRSTDSGRTWVNLGSSMYQGLQVVLPATYPAEPTIYAVGGAGLQRSDDGGRSFSTVVPSATSASSAPQAVASTPELALGTVPLLLYQEKARTVLPGPALPVGVDEVDDLAFTARGTLLVTAMQREAGAAGTSLPVLLQCASLHGKCSVLASFGGGSALHIVTDAGDPNAVLVYGPTQIDVSSDGGQSFTAAGPMTGALTSLALGRSDTMYGVTMQTVDGGVTTTLVRSTDGGADFVAMPSPDGGQGADVGVVEVLPDGHLIVALMLRDARGEFGLRCSLDGGRSWSLGC